MEGKEKVNYINQIKSNKIKKPQIKRKYRSNTYQRKDWGPPYREKSQGSILTNETQLKKITERYNGNLGRTQLKFTSLLLTAIH